jgi:protein involved in temperature-dependent protein secretion
VWEEQEGEAVPFGQKTLVVDGEDFPLLELRRLEIAGVEEAPQSHATTQ